MLIIEVKWFFLIPQCSGCPVVELRKNGARWRVRSSERRPPSMRVEETLFSRLLFSVLGLSREGSAQCLREDFRGEGFGDEGIGRKLAGHYSG